MSAPWPEPRRAWTVVAILLLANAVSFVDRQVINLLTEALKQDLGISDTQIGLLQGVAFGVFYTLVGLPLGRLSDRWNRRSVILLGAGLWSLMTSACGLARSFTQLFWARVGVGVGEAALSPAAMSIISDYFPPERRALPLSFYMTGTSLGGGIALLIGGAVIGLVSTADGISLPWLGDLRPWQAAFLAVGVPSLLLLPLLALVREPPRRGRAESSQLVTSWRASLGFVWQRRGFYLGHHLGLALLAVYTFGIAAWTPALLIRRFDWTAPEVGAAYGLITLACGVPGVLAGGAVAGWLRARGRLDANWRVMIGGACALLPCAVLAPLGHSAAWVLALLCPVTFLTTFPLGVAAAALQEATPNELRAQVSATYLFVLNLVGLGLGPVGVGLLTDRWFGDPLALGQAMALLAALAGPFAIISLWIGWRRRP
ncbi:MAG: MFS transporter [Steroidobacteraceae bacterium]